MMTKNLMENLLIEFVMIKVTNIFMVRNKEFIIELIYINIFLMNFVKYSYKIIIYFKTVL